MFTIENEGTNPPRSNQMNIVDVVPIIAAVFNVEERVAHDALATVADHMKYPPELTPKHIAESIKLIRLCMDFPVYIFK